LKSLQETLRRESDELAILNGLTKNMEGCDDIFAHIIANQVRFYPFLSADGVLDILNSICLTFLSFFTAQLLKIL